MENLFNYNWELCKFGVTNSYFTDGNYGESYPSADELSDKLNGVPFLRGCNLKNGRLVEEDANYITPEKHAELTSGHLELDDIVVAVRGSLGALGYAGQENVGWNINSQLAIIRTDKSELKGQFLIQYLLSSKGQKELLSRNTGTALKQLPIKQLKDVPVPIPIIDEQDKIGSFFVNLDTTITLHQRKLEQLKEFKKAYLQVMFPEKDERVPKLRFADFEEEWEHRKLDDSIKVMDGDRGANYPHDTDFFKDGDTLFLDTGNVTKNGFKFDSVKYITNEKDEQLRAGKLEKNDFVLTSRGTLGNVGFYDEVVYNLHPKIRINSAMLILRNTDEQLSYSYLHTLLKGQLISDFMKKNQLGSAQPHITKSEFLKLNLNVPRNINEQNKIGNFFKSLDVTITLHQNKLTQLKSLKKSYLQNMFI